jgi:hypothetical protein
MWFLINSSRYTNFPTKGLRSKLEVFLSLMCSCTYLLHIIQIILRESTFITPRGGGGGGGVGGMKMSWKKHFFYRAPVKVIGKFSTTPPSPFDAPPPLESKEYNPEFSPITDTICSSSRCLIYSSTCFSSTKIPTCCFLISPHYRQMKWHRLQKNILDWL